LQKIAIDIRKINDYGIGTYLVELISNLPVDEREFHYFLFGEKREGNAELFERPDFTFLPDTTPKYSMREIWAIPKLLKHIGADLYHSPHYVIPFKTPCPVVVTIHDIIHLLFPEFLSSKKALLYAKLMMKNAVFKSDAVIAISQNTRSDLINRYPSVSPGKIHVVYNGVCDYFSPAKGTCTDGGYILYVGSLRPHKNVITLINAFATLRNSLKRTEKLFMVGEPPDKYPELLEAVQKKGIADSVVWHGYKSDEEVLSFYRNAAVFAFPSLYEGFGLPPLEAMACGTPVIASSSSSLKEVVGNAGILAEPTSTKEWVEGLLKIMDDRDVRGSLSIRGVKRAKGFSCQRMAYETCEVYRKTLNNVQ